MAYYKEEIQPVNPSDEALMARAQAGEMPALEVLVRRYEKRLFNYIRKMIGNTADAEDIFQETFLRVYKHLNRFRTSALFRPWLYRIATNLCTDQLRYRGRHPKVSLDVPVGDDANGPSTIERVEGKAPGPRDVAEGHEMEDRLQNALNKLSTKHRTVFIMARYEGMPYDEIADAFNIPVGTVKSRMNKAVKMLLSEIKEEAG